MKTTTFITALALGLTLAVEGIANDINSSWSVTTLQGQAMSHTVKQAKMQKFTSGSRPKIRPDKPSANGGHHTPIQADSSTQVRKQNP